MTSNQPTAATSTRTTLTLVAISHRPRGLPKTDMVTEVVYYDQQRKAETEATVKPKSVYNKILKLVKDPRSGLVEDPTSGLISSTLKLGSMELAALAGREIEDDVSLGEALSRPTLQRSCEDALLHLFEDRPLHVNVFRSTDVALKVSISVLHNAMPMLLSLNPKHLS